MITPTEILTTKAGQAALARCTSASQNYRVASERRMLAYLRLPASQLERLATSERNPYDRVAAKECAKLKRELGLD